MLKLVPQLIVALKYNVYTPIYSIRQKKLTYRWKIGALQRRCFQKYVNFFVTYTVGMNISRSYIWQIRYFWFFSQEKKLAVYNLVDWSWLSTLCVSVHIITRLYPIPWWQNLNLAVLSYIHQINFSANISYHTVL